MNNLMKDILLIMIMWFCIFQILNIINISRLTLGNGILIGLDLLGMIIIAFFRGYNYAKAKRTK
jgi:hypothetical protein